MKKIRNILTLPAIALSLFGLGLIITGQGESIEGYIILQPVQILILSVFLILLSLLTMISEKSEVFNNSREKSIIRILLLLSMTLLVVIQIISHRETGDEHIIKRFRKIYFGKDSYVGRYLGILSLQYPTDNWVMQEIISEIKPDFIIETGTFNGGTTLFYADILEKVNRGGRVITIDHRNLVKEASQKRNWRERVDFYQADSTAPGLVGMIAEKVKGKKVLVTLDSSHTKRHVLRELELYSPLVSPGSYIIVQDTHLGGHPNSHISVPGEGPREAVEEFLKNRDDFVIDHSRERHLVSQNPSGYLRKVR